VTDLTTWFSGSEGEEKSVSSAAEAKKTLTIESGPKPSYLKLMTCFRLLSGGEWKKISWDEIHKLKVRELISGPYAIRLDEQKSYFCGNDDVWFAIPEGKAKEWIHEVMKSMFQPCVNAGMTWEKIFGMRFRSALSLSWAKSILGGTFLNRDQGGEGCNSNQAQESIPF